MKRLLALLFAISTPSWATFCGNYTYQRTITVSSSGVSNVLGAVNNFPVPIITNDVTISTGAGGHLLNSSGFDVIFSTDTSCNFMMSWDTETVNNTGSNNFVAWVKVPTLSTASATAATFYMTYGNAAISSYQGHSTATWDSSFFGVWHLGNGTALSGKDSTSNANNGTLNGPPTAVAGKLDGAASFPGSTGTNISFSGAASTSPFTFSGWVNITGGSFGAILGDFNQGGTPEIRTDSANTISFLSAGIAGIGTSNSALSTSTWYHVATSYDSATWKIYINGLLDNSGSSSQAFANGGAHNLGTTSGEAYNGKLDEARLSNVIRNADWIKTEYLLESSTASYITITGEPGPPLPPPPVMTINNVKIYGPLIIQ